MSCGGIGMCGKRPDCHDTHCEGHPINSDAELTRRIQEAESRWAVEAIGVEASLTGITFVGPEPEEPEPFDWQGLVLWIGVGVAFGAIAALSIADPRDLSSFWPRVLAALSF